MSRPKSSPPPSKPPSPPPNPSTLPPIEPIHKNILLYISADPLDVLHYRELNKYSFLVHRKYEREIWRNVSEALMSREELAAGQAKEDEDTTESTSTAPTDPSPSLRNRKGKKSKAATKPSTNSTTPPKLFSSANQYISEQFLQQVQKKQDRMLSNFRFCTKVQNWLYLFLVMYIILFAVADFAWDPLARTPELYQQTHDPMAILFETRSKLLPSLLDQYETKMKEEQGLGVLRDLVHIHNGVRDKFYRGTGREMSEFPSNFQLSSEIERLIADASRSESCLAEAHACINRLIKSRVANAFSEKPLQQSIEQIFTPDVLSKMQLLFRVYPKKQPTESIFQQQRELIEALAETLERRLSDDLLNKLLTDLPRIERQAHYALYDVYIGDTHLVTGKTIRILLMSIYIFVVVYVALEKYVQSLDRAMLERVLVSMDEVKSMSKEQRTEWQQKYGYFMWRYSKLDSRSFVLSMLRELGSMISLYSVVSFAATFYVVRIVYSLMELLM